MDKEKMKATLRPSRAKRPENRVRAKLSHDVDVGQEVSNGVKIVAETLETVSIHARATSPRLREQHAQSPYLSTNRQPTSTTMPTKRTASMDKTANPSKASGGVPTPTDTYIAATNPQQQLLQDPQHLLVIIDLNGTLLFRPSKTNPTRFVARPHAQQFLQYCVDTFTVVIWSSAKPANVSNMCNAILTGLRGKVTAIWGRDKFGLSASDYNQKVQCYKRLTKIWTDPEIAKSHPAYQMGRRWDQTNTVLVDDSLEKARSEPFNLIEVPEFLGDLNELDLLPQVHDYLNYLAMHTNVSACIRMQPFRARRDPAR